METVSTAEWHGGGVVENSRIGIDGRAINRVIESGRISIEEQASNRAVKTSQTVLKSGPATEPLKGVALALRSGEKVEEGEATGSARPAACAASTCGGSWW